MTLMHIKDMHMIHSSIKKTAHTPIQLESIKKITIEKIPMSDSARLTVLSWFPGAWFSAEGNHKTTGVLQ